MLCDLTYDMARENFDAVLTELEFVLGRVAVE